MKGDFASLLVLRSDFWGCIVRVILVRGVLRGLVRVAIVLSDRVPNRGASCQTSTCSVRRMRTVALQCSTESQSCFLTSGVGQFAVSGGGSDKPHV